ncbi:MAG: family 10 glycosylhydrolase [Candidatus Marinimicrobia bacterium]|nr:family 10 glycosylhydrolase [Candidatus Neomarinimicrobiota bacterium]
MILKKHKSKRTAAFLILISSLMFSAFVCNKETGTQTKYETRSVWVTRFDYTINIDSTDSDSQKAAISNYFKIAKESNLNTVFFQVRGSFDAYYNSNYEPWAKALSGSLGVDPGWDPLKFAIKEADENGLKLHAWVNTFTLWKGEEPPERSEVLHAFYAHPEWIVADSNGTSMQLNSHYVYVNPGNPEVRKHVINVVKDIVTNYDVDGIHFDYIRYPERASRAGYSHDTVSVNIFNEKNGNPDSLDWEDWQRNNINLFVKAVKDSVSKLKPNIALSAAVLGKYRKPGWSGYDAVYQDAVPWIKNGWLDFIVPMAYTTRDNKSASFTSLIQEWNELTGKSNSVLAGIAVYRAEGIDGWGWSEIAHQIIDARKQNLRGMAFFNVTALKSDWWEIQRALFSHPVLPYPLERPDVMAVRAANIMNKYSSGD